MRLLGILNPQRFWLRWPLKWLILGVVSLCVLFPRLDRLPTSLSRYLDPNSLIDSESPVLQPWLEEFQAERKPAWNDKRTIRKLKEFVYGKIKYEWDWNLWGNADYFPTVKEAVELGKEDCDGRAIVAASMLQKLGYKAHLATDFSHMWVVTDHGETMNPGKRKSIEYSDKGPKYNWSAIRDLPKHISLGISVFPLKRELIIVLVVWLMMMGRHARFRHCLIWLTLLIIGLMLIREGGRPRNSDLTKDVIGFALWALAWIGLIVQTWLNGYNQAEEPANLLPEEAAS